MASYHLLMMILLCLSCSFTVDANPCISAAMGLQSGPCAAQAALMKDAAGNGGQTCEALASLAPPSPDCCAQLAAFAGDGACACDAATLSMAALMGVTEAAIKGVLRGASAVCAKAGGPAVAGPCFDAC